MWVIEMRISEIPAPPAAEMPERVEALSEAGEHTVYNAAQGTLTVRSHQDRTDDPLQAAAEAKEGVLAAVEAAGVTGAQVQALTVMTEDEEARRLMHPETLDVVGATEAARILGVSQPRATALLGEASPRRDPQAPRPVVTTGAGALYLRQAVERYASRRDTEQVPWKHTTG